MLQILVLYTKSRCWSVIWRSHFLDYSLHTSPLLRGSPTKSGEIYPLFLANSSRFRDESTEMMTNVLSFVTDDYSPIPRGAFSGEGRVFFYMAELGLDAGVDPDNNTLLAMRAHLSSDEKFEFACFRARSICLFLRPWQRRSSLHLTFELQLQSFQGPLLNSSDHLQSIKTSSAQSQLLA